MSFNWRVFLVMLGSIIACALFAGLFAKLVSFLDERGIHPLWAISGFILMWCAFLAMFIK